MEERDFGQRTLCGIPLVELTDFPTTGHRARAFRRFERDLQSWLATSEGRFAAWRAARLLDDSINLR
jgi:hypothetical protein